MRDKIITNCNISKKVKTCNPIEDSSEEIIYTNKGEENNCKGRDVTEKKGYY